MGGIEGQPKIAPIVGQIIADDLPTAPIIWDDLYMLRHRTNGVRIPFMVMIGS